MYGRWIILALVGTALRLFLIKTISADDNYYEGKFNEFTDLDYKVFLDASLYDSPYERHTYRYSPILSWMMSPSYKYNQAFGKYLLVVFDVLACFFTFKIFAERKGEDNLKRGLLAAGLTFTNPYLIYISIRGSCEGITLTLGAIFLYLYFGGQATGNMTAGQRQQKGIVDLQPCRVRRYFAYAFYGLWVHFRVFPILLLPMLIMYEYYSVKQNRWKHLFKFILEFGLVSGGVFLGLTAYFYCLYGYEFLHQTYFYHLTRRDHRLSRSISFYDIYLNYAQDAETKPLYRIVFRNLPNWIILAFFCFYLISKRSFFYCQGFLIMYFVVFNRVFTDQYYTWIFGFLYMALDESKSSVERKWIKLIVQAYIPMAILVGPVASWIYFANKFQNCTQGINIWYLWIINSLSISLQVLVITSLTLSMLKPYEGNKQICQPLAKPVKND